MSYVIGSFNLLKMDFKSNDETKKNFDRIADIIREEQFDVLALQEVMTEMAVNELIKRLGPMYWDSVFKPSTITASKDAQREGYAFLWKKRRLHLVDAASAVELKDEYRIRRDGSGAFIHQGSLVRPPLVIRLTPQGLLGGSNFELRLINTHIAFNSPVNCADRYNDAVLRRMELKVLAEEVYRKVSSKRYGINIPAYTILMGDYNLCLAGGGTPVVEEIIDIICSQRPMCVGNQQALGCCQAHRHLASAGFSASSVEKYHCPVYESSPYQWQTGICSWSSRLAAFAASWRTLCKARRTGMYLLVWIFNFQGSVRRLSVF